MCENINKFGKDSLKSYLKTGSRITLAAIMLFSLCGCALADKSTFGNLDENISAAIDNARDIGYPNLAAVPNTPANLKSNSEWNQFEAQMNNQTNAFTDEENSAIAQPVDTSWAANSINNLNKNPLAAQAPNENPEAFAARVRAMLNSNSQ